MKTGDGGVSSIVPSFISTIFPPFLLFHLSICLFEDRGRWCVFNCSKFHFNHFSTIPFVSPVNLLICLIDIPFRIAICRNTGCQKAPLSLFELINRQFFGDEESSPVSMSPLIKQFFWCIFFH